VRFFDVDVLAWCGSVERERGGVVRARVPALHLTAGRAALVTTSPWKVPTKVQVIDFEGGFIGKSLISKCKMVHFASTRTSKNRVDSIQAISAAWLSALGY
jgi:hypothetical protein